MTTKSKILLVDDEQDITTNLAAFLGRSGFDTLTAGNGEEALGKIEREAPDLIVLDVMMPKMDGRETLRSWWLGRNLTRMGKVSHARIFIRTCPR